MSGLAPILVPAAPPARKQRSELVRSLRYGTDVTLRYAHLLCVARGAALFGFARFGFSDCSHVFFHVFPRCWRVFTPSGRPSAACAARGLGRPARR